MRLISSSPNRTEQVYAMILESICDCTLEPGTHLVQEDLAATLGVSRQPVQQAMLLLKTDGLVVEKGGRGLYVAPLDPPTIAHRYEIRMVLDDLAARLVARRVRARPSFANELREIGGAILAEGQEALSEGDAASAVSHDVRFHEFIYDMSGNPLISATAHPHWQFLRRVMISVLLHAERGALVWTQHSEILELLASGDEEAGADLVRRHIVGARGALFDALEVEDTTRDLAAE